jgi:hypothetical protein
MGKERPVKAALEALRTASLKGCKRAEAALIQAIMQTMPAKTSTSIRPPFRRGLSAGSSPGRACTPAL